MDRIMPVIISLSISGTVLALLLLILKPIIKNLVSKSFMYYIWILVLLRSVLPIGTPVDVIETIFARMSHDVIEDTYIQPDRQPNNTNDSQTYIDGKVSNLQDDHIPNIYSENRAVTTTSFNFWTFLQDNILTIWLLGVISHLLYSCIAYYRFSHRVIENSSMSHDLDKELFCSLYTNKRLRFICSKYIKVPMHIGVVRPYIVVPQMAYVENGMQKELEYILRHEITHYQKKDLIYKWFMLFVTSLHWFNPFMRVVRKNIDNACELACDEAVIKDMTPSQRMQYGETLIKMSGKIKMPMVVSATTLSNQKDILKERIMSIKMYRAKSLEMSIAAIVLTLMLLGCASALGPIAPSVDSTLPLAENKKSEPDVSSKAPATTLETATPKKTENLENKPSASPLPMPERKGKLNRKPINENSALSPLELPSQTKTDFSDIYAWQYSIEPVDFDSMLTTAEKAANRLWRNVTREDLISSHIVFKSETTDTEYGPYRESISISYDDTFAPYVALDYAGLWEDYEDTAYHYGEQIEKKTSELIDIAKDFADSIFGPGQYTKGIPTVYEYKRGLVSGPSLKEDDRVEAAQHARITWRYMVDGLPVGYDGLTVEIANSRVARLSLARHELSRRAVQEPDFILDAEEALYCLNYTRSHITDEESIFKSCPTLLSVSPILSNTFSKDFDEFVPTWEFIIAPRKDEPAYIYDVHVNATTGEVHTNTNEGTYPSPYVH